MALPTLNVPTDTVKLHSVKQPVKVRPYLVGEEKILLMAQAAQLQGDKSEVEKAVRQIVARCAFGEVSIDTLPVFDLTYLFLKLRSMSLNNVIESQFRCQNQVPKPHESADTLEKFGLELEPEMKPCGTLVPVRININDIKLTVPEGHSNKVVLGDYGIVLKYPTAPLYDDAQKAADLVAVLSQCLETIYEVKGDKVWEASQESPEDIAAFVEQLSFGDVEKIRTTFFDTMPRLTHTFTFKCPKCGYTEDVVLQELEDFFV